MPDAPASTADMAADVSKALGSFEASGDWEGGLALLSAVDSARAAALSRNDWYRLGRALEVARAEAAAATEGSGSGAGTEAAVSPRGAGFERNATRAAAEGGEDGEDGDGGAEAVGEKRPSSGMESTENADPDGSGGGGGGGGGGGRGSERDCYDFRCVFLAPSDRRHLFERIDERCETIILDGLLQEVSVADIPNADAVAAADTPGPPARHQATVRPTRANVPTHTRLLGS